MSKNKNTAIALQSSHPPKDGHTRSYRWRQGAVHQQGGASETGVFFHRPTVAEEQDHVGWSCW